MVRAARHRMPLMLAIIGGEPARFAPFVDLYHRALGEFGHDSLPVGCHCPGHVADTDEQAIEEAWPHHRVLHGRIAAERGWSPMTRSDFEAQVGPRGALYVGSPETVARKIAATSRALGLSRFTLKIGSGPMPDALQRHSIELFGAEVIPRVRELLADGASQPPGTMAP